ncbi:MAG: hypothetical protein IT236_16530 [Bacteroidia bacterium]|nr:hypothetical protein [Bacteroidia bacterium]
MAKMRIRLVLFLMMGFIATALAGALLVIATHYFATKSCGFFMQWHGWFYVVGHYCSVEPRNWQSGWLIVCASAIAVVMLFASAAVLKLYKTRQIYRNAQSLSLGQWAIIFVCMFWVERVFALPALVLSKLAGRKTFLRWLGDFYNFPAGKVNDYFNWPTHLTELVTGGLGLLALAWVIFYVLPKALRDAFLMAMLLSAMVSATTFYVMAQLIY